MSALVALLAGLVFGVGLIVSGMSNPAKVLGFLDITGAWDPSLVMVMVGAITVAGGGFAVAKRRHVSWTGASIQLPAIRDVDARLVVGSALFGLGWGLAGFCPGPALVALGSGHVKAFVFVAAMIAGMVLFEGIERARRVLPEGAPAE